jgi:hypothetical protein
VHPPIQQKKGQMPMFRRRVCMTIAVIALGATVSATAQPPRNSPSGRAAVSGTSASSRFLAIPGLLPLSMEGVLRDIRISPEQRQQLRTVSDGYLNSVQQLAKTFQDLSPEEQKQQAKEFNDRVAQLARNAQRKAEAILSPKQLQTVQRIAFQLSVAGGLSDPAMQEKLGLSPQQREQLNAIFEQAGEKMQQLQRDTAQQAIEVLDDQQTAALKKQIDSQPKER